MKQIITTLVLSLVVLMGYAQSPEKFSYQTIVHDLSNVLVINSTTPMKVSILQNSSSGTVVYTEFHEPITNENGLASIQVGNGFSSVGTIADIAWGTDLYFIITKIDVDNNGTYDLTNVSQLLSMPYALHAKTVETVIENQTLSNSVGLGNSAGNQLKNVADPTDAQDAVTKIYTDELIAELNARLTALELAASYPEIGDYRDGGVVFWIDPNDPTHGLVCTTTDIETAVKWGCSGTDIPGATASSIGNGEANTIAIESGCSTAGIAAEIAVNLTHNGFSDWYLPSRGELYEMFNAMVQINSTSTLNGGTAFSTVTPVYWSSTQVNINSAYIRTMMVNGIEIENSKSGIAGLRAIRAF